MINDKVKEVQYNNVVQKIGKELNMKHMTPLERHFELCGSKKHLTNQIKIKFNEIPEDYINKINDADRDTLEKWVINFVFANSLDEVFA